MFLPLHAAGGGDTAASCVEASKEIRQLKAVHPMRALVVDDSRVVRMILGKTLMELGFEVAESEDGQKAIDRLYMGESFDLMLVDWNMPNMNGYEMIRAVRANVLLSEVKIMMVTTETSLEHVRMALEAGANEYLMKPFTEELLLKKLQLMGIS